MDVAVGVRFPIEVTEISMDRNFGLDSASDNQSVVRDGGDCFRLMESGGWNPELVKPDKRADCDTATLSPSPRLVIRNNVDSVDSVDGADSAYGLDDNVSESSAELDSVIRTALWPPHETNHNFLPLDELERLITIKAVFQELRKHETFRQKPDDYLRGLANKVCRNSKVGSFITTRKKIFGTLLLITQIHAIERFIEDDLWDKDLPFSLERLNRNTKHSKNEMYREDKSPIRLFSTWTSHNCESFYLYQWKFLTPFFKMALTDNTRPLHYPLHKHHVLPFIENLENAGSDCEIMVSGGFSEVWRVKIHEAHYNCVPNSNPYFAVKRLRPQDDIMIKFKREVATLKRLSGQNHAHLMQLQLTYEWRGHYHLLFIWADGNLKDLWKSYPELSGPKSLPRNKELATWVSQQLLGLTKALQVIHQCPPDLQVDDNSEEGPDDTESRRTHGRHGDLKPENILWFRGTDSQEARLVISDFGLTQFHRRETGKLDPAKIARTPTYRPPEYDTGPKITQSFDIWTWGCVLLEFCVWYLKGYDEWDRFSKRRVVEHHGSFYKEDVYFNTGSPQPTCTATLKTSVIDQIVALRQDENVPQFIVDLLDLIELRLLRMDLGDRATCDEVVLSLDLIHQKCQQSENYCVTPVPGSFSKYRHPDPSQCLPSTTKWVSPGIPANESYLPPSELISHDSDDDDDDDDRSGAEDTSTFGYSTNYSQSALDDTEMDEGVIEETSLPHQNPELELIHSRANKISNTVQATREPERSVERSLNRKRKRDRLLRIFCGAAR